MTDFLTRLECSKTGETYDPEIIQNLSKEGAPLLARYDLEKIKQRLKKDDLQGRKANMWRYEELLPVSDPAYKITLGEGFTPLRKTDTLGQHTGFKNLFVKDESINPTGSFKARGISMALSAALERGATEFVIPSAGNAAGALAAYAAEAGVKAHVFMPDDTPQAFILECEYYGADVHLVDGLIDDCGRIVQQKKQTHDWFDVSTLKEPYRLEGKKTMGLELAEQLNWELPDVIVYPTGGGTGLIGIWKAFDELEQMGWISGQKPRMISVQAEGCAPIVKAFEEGKQYADPWEDAKSLASGIRVPGAVGDFLILEALRESEGGGVTVSDEMILEYSKMMAKHTGIFPAPEGGATLAGLIKLKERGLVDEDERIVLINTGSGYKYLEAFQDEKTVKMEEGYKV